MFLGRPLFLLPWGFEDRACLVMLAGEVDSVTYTWLHMTPGSGRRLGLTRSQLERKTDHILLGKPKTEMPEGPLTGTNVPQG